MSRDAQAPPKPTSPWKLEESIWAPRAQWCDSKDFWDTEACARRMLQTDYTRAIAVGLGSFIARNDTDGESGGEGAEEEIEEVREVLWLHQPMIYMLFDAYAALGTSGTDIFAVGFNSFALFADTFGLISKKSRHCKAADFDGL